VVVDDCSTDGTADLLDQFVKDVRRQKVSYAAFWDEKNNEIVRKVHSRYPQAGRELKIIRNRDNMGSTKTYNRGFQESTGKYCTYIASDDICHPTMMSTMAEIIDSTPVDFVYSDMVVVEDTGRILREFRLPDYSFEESFCNWYLCGVSKLYRRHLHDAFGYYNEKFLANDHELYLRFAINGVRFKHIPKVLYSVRSHEHRQENVHNPTNWSRLLKESCELVTKARLFQLLTDKE
jgi:glycosyltransferase involved in cell wall biosynthesis